MGRLLFAFAFAIAIAISPSARAQEQPVQGGQVQQPVQGGQVQRQMEGGQVHSGFALELHLGTQFLNLGGGAGTTINVGAVQGGFLAGYKVSRFIFGLGFELSRVASGTSTITTDTDRADTAIMFVPGLRVAFYRTPDGR